MGLQKDYYIGPYLECHWHYRKTILQVEVKSYDFDREDFDDVFNDTGEVTILDETDLLILKCRNYNDRRLCTSEIYNYEIFPSLINDELSSFKFDYKDIIQKIRKKYDSVEIKWGIIMRAY
jgi:hypothetical protein